MVVDPQFPTGEQTRIETLSNTSLKILNYRNVAKLKDADDLKSGGEYPARIIFTDNIPLIRDAEALDYRDRLVTLGIVGGLEKQLPKVSTAWAGINGDERFAGIKDGIRTEIREMRDLLQRYPIEGENSRADYLYASTNDRYLTHAGLVEAKAIPRSRSTRLTVYASSLEAFDPVAYLVAGLIEPEDFTSILGHLSNSTSNGNSPKLSKPRNLAVDGIQTPDETKTVDHWVNLLSSLFPQ